jgi:hypothetical protein
MKSAYLKLTLALLALSPLTWHSTTGCVPAKALDKVEKIYQENEEIARSIESYEDVTTLTHEQKEVMACKLIVYFLLAPGRMSYTQLVEKFSELTKGMPQFADLRQAMLDACRETSGTKISIKLKKYLDQVPQRIKAELNRRKVSAGVIVRALDAGLKSEMTCPLEWEEVMNVPL